MTRFFLHFWRWRTKSTFNYSYLASVLLWKNLYSKLHSLLLGIFRKQKDIECKTHKRRPDYSIPFVEKIRYCRNTNREYASCLIFWVLSLLRRLRLNNQTWNDFDTWNTRFIDRNDPLSPVNEELENVQEEENVIFPVACQGNNSRHSINWLSMKELLNATKRKSTPILCSPVFDGAIRGKRPTKSELEQLLGLGDHKLNRLSPLLPMLPGLPVHITQNIAPKIGLANGSTGTIVGYQFPKGTIFKPM